MWDLQATRQLLAQAVERLDHINRGAGQQSESQVQAPRPRASAVSSNQMPSGARQQQGCHVQGVNSSALEEHRVAACALSSATATVGSNPLEYSSSKVVDRTPTTPFLALHRIAFSFLRLHCHVPQSYCVTGQGVRQTFTAQFIP